ncbi:MAG: hypothetical protein UHS54_04370 [Lachnospiraceae bacterium]|nr:hypothetical protein [Lachnospiraceae bacterium]
MKNDFLEKLLGVYRSSFDLLEPYELCGETYDAYGFCDITSAKYVLMKKAELWRAICYEHAFFKMFRCLTPEDIERFAVQAAEKIEPMLVRKGRACMEKDHMYSYITGIFISENAVPDEVKKKVKKAHFYKNYRLSIRGYCELRILVIDLENKKLTGNAAARGLIKDYKRFF